MCGRGGGGGVWLAAGKFEQGHAAARGAAHRPSGLGPSLRPHAGLGCWLGVGGVGSRSVELCAWERESPPRFFFFLHAKRVSMGAEKRGAWSRAPRPLPGATAPAHSWARRSAGGGGTGAGEAGCVGHARGRGRGERVAPPRCARAFFFPLRHTSLPSPGLCLLRARHRPPPAASASSCSTTPPSRRAWWACRTRLTGATWKQSVRCPKTTRPLTRLGRPPTALAARC